MKKYLVALLSITLFISVMSCDKTNTDEIFEKKDEIVSDIIDASVNPNDTTDGKTDDGTTDGKTDDGTTDGKTDDGTTDGKTDDGTTDGKTDDGTTDGKTDDGTTDGDTTNNDDYVDDIKDNNTDESSDSDDDYIVDDNNNDSNTNDDSNNNDSNTNDDNFIVELYKVNNTAEQSPDSFTTKMLLEDITATWCFACPQMLEKIESAMARNKNIIPIGIHDSDPMGVDASSILGSKFNQKSFPHGQLNRLTKWKYWSYNELERFTSRYCDLGISISTTYENSTIKGVFKYGICSKIYSNLSYVIYVLENDLKYYQKSGKDLHNHVLRKCLTDLFGNKIPAEYKEKGKVYSVGFEWKLDESKYKHQNMDVVVFILNDDTGEVLNVQKVELGRDANFD